MQTAGPAEAVTSMRAVTLMQAETLMQAVTLVRAHRPTEAPVGRTKKRRLGSGRGTRPAPSARAPAARRIPLRREAALALASGLAAFVLVAVVLATADSNVVAMVLGVATLAGVLAIARLFGASYAIPVAIAVLVAYDWFQFPPTHAEELPDSQSLLALLGNFV